MAISFGLLKKSLNLKIHIDLDYLRDTIQYQRYRTVEQSSDPAGESSENMRQEMVVHHRKVT